MRAGRALSASIRPGAARGWRAGARGVPDPAARARQAERLQFSVAELFIIKEMDPDLFTKFFTSFREGWFCPGSKLLAKSRLERRGGAAARSPAS